MSAGGARGSVPLNLYTLYPWTGVVVPGQFQLRALHHAWLLETISFHLFLEIRFLIKKIGFRKGPVFKGKSIYSYSFVLIFL